MSGLPDGGNSVFGDPDPKGDRAARRYINTITYENGVIAKLAGLAQMSRTKTNVTKFNTCRETLERSVNLLRQCTDITAVLEPKVRKAVSIGDAALGVHLPIAPVVSQSDTSLTSINNSVERPAPVVGPPGQVQGPSAPAAETLQPPATRAMEELISRLPTDAYPSTGRPNSGERVAGNDTGAGPTGFGAASAGCPNFRQSSHISLTSTPVAGPNASSAASAGCPNFQQPSHISLSAAAPRAYGRSQGDAAHRAAPAPTSNAPSSQNQNIQFNPEAEIAEMRKKYLESKESIERLRQQIIQLEEIVEECEPTENSQSIPTPVRPSVAQIVHPNDRTQNQLKSRLLAFATESVPPDRTAGSVPASRTPTMTSVYPGNSQPNPQSNPNLPSQSRSVHSSQSANPYAYLTPSQNNPTPSLGGGDSDLAASLLTVNLRTHSRELMMMGRPEKEKRFSGKPGEDFESVMATFDRVTSLPGITDDLRCLELGHWLSGNPLIILTQYDKVREADVAYGQIRAHLERIYGRKVFTAKEMTSDLTKGNKLKDPEEIEEFLLRLEKIYVDAVATSRDATFSTNDTYTELLQKKLPHFYIIKWATKKTKADNEYMKDKTKPYSLNFPTFVAFCREINDTSRNQLAITGHTKNKKGHNNNHQTRSHDIAATSAQSAAPGNRPNFQGGRGKGKKGFNRPGQNNQTNKQPTQTQPASTQNPMPPNKQNFSATMTAKPAPPTRNPTPPARVPGSCHCIKCNVSTHATIKCHGMWAMDREGRTNAVKEAKSCFRCFGNDHFSKKCPRPISCTECQSDRHNALFHNSEK